MSLASPAYSSNKCTLCSGSFRMMRLMFTAPCRSGNQILHSLFSSSGVLCGYRMGFLLLLTCSAFRSEPDCRLLRCWFRRSRCRRMTLGSLSLLDLSLRILPWLSGRYCRGKQIIFLSLFCFSLFCPGMPCFARVSGVMMICSENADCGKSEQDGASCYYLLVVKLVVKGKWRLLIFLSSMYYFKCILFWHLKMF